MTAAYGHQGTSHLRSRLPPSVQRLHVAIVVVIVNVVVVVVLLCFVCLFDGI